MRHPLLYEIPTRPWLRERAGGAFAGVGDDVLDGFASHEITHVWLMGLWPTGPQSRAEAVRNDGLRRAYAEALPGFVDDDIVGSPYAIAATEVAPDLGGDAGLASLRARLHARDIAVLADFIPNHLGLDHPWVHAHPTRFVHARQELPESVPVTVDGQRFWVLHGKDPWFPGWTDTVQLDYRKKETRAAMLELLLAIADRADGVRCDMAMLVLQDVFARTWGHVASSVLERADAAEQFWSGAIEHVKARHPKFLFLAEAYWDLEPELLALGFDYTYDKKLTDLLVHDRPHDVQRHLLTMPAARVATSAHFLENHDEPRIASALPFDAHRAAALTTLGIPGMRFLFDGQLEGRKTFARIQLARRKPEPTNVDIAQLYESLLAALAGSVVGKGSGALLQPCAAWAGNESHEGFVIAQWQMHDDAFDLVVVNHAPHRAQCRVWLAGEKLGFGSWRMRDRLSSERYERDGGALAREGLFLDVAPRAAQLFAFTRAP